MTGILLNNASDICLGSTLVSAVYIGSTKIWPSAPHDYSQDYLTFEAIQPTSFSYSSVRTNTIQYSLDNGSTWTTLAAGNSTPTLSAGAKILWKNVDNTMYYSVCKFLATGNFKAYGNVMSLLYGDNFIGQTDLSESNREHSFQYLFKDNDKLVDASNLVLPATILSSNCYAEMFYECTSLIAPPELSATIYAQECCYQMFYGCTSLTATPTLLASTLALDCCYEMFCGCTTLTAVELPSAAMPASGCYFHMFKDCTSLNYVKCLATTVNSACTLYWLDNVASAGTFVKDANTTWITGSSGIPNGWTTQNA